MNDIKNTNGITSGTPSPWLASADGVTALSASAIAGEIVGAVGDVAVGDVAVGVAVVGDLGIGASVGASVVCAGSSNGTASEKLNGSLWKFTGKIHYLTVRDPLTGVFKSFAVGSLNEAFNRAREYSQKVYDVYFSPAEFMECAKTRKAQDVACVRGFWVDIDVKAAQGQWYATLAEAKAAIKAFRIAAGLPRPTHVVISGNGLHVYWVLSDPIDPTQWLAYAKRFKELTKALGLLADPTRTADIASLMRFPETFNFKDKAKPLAVELIYASDVLIQNAVMLNAIDAAHTAHCGLGKTQTASMVKMQVSPATAASVLPKQWVMVPAQLQKLASALCVLSPDIDEKSWSLYRIAPIARAARENPDFAIDLYLLGRRWSSGELRGLPSKAWTSPGGQGRTGEQYFDILWKRFLNDGYMGGRTLGSIYYDAKLAGWIDPDASSSKWERA